MIPNHHLVLVIAINRKLLFVLVKIVLIAINKDFLFLFPNNIFSPVA